MQMNFQQEQLRVQRERENIEERRKKQLEEQQRIAFIIEEQKKIRLQNKIENEKAPEKKNAPSQKEFPKLDTPEKKFIVIKKKDKNHPFQNENKFKNNL